MKHSIRIVRWTLLLGVLVTSAVLGFKPTEESFGHTKITRDVLRRGYTFASSPSVPKFTTKMAADGKVIEFSEDAAAQVVEGNQSTDWLLPAHTRTFEGVSITIQGEINREEAHCDNDRIAECSNRIITKKQQVIQGVKSYLAGGRKEPLVNARVQLGKALHTLQDFYAHSNWTDNHAGASIFSAMTAGGVAPAVHGRLTSTCAARRENAALPAGWDNNGGNYALTSDGKAPAKVTSGYFDNFRSVGNFSSAADTPAAKCDHGVEVLNRQVSGINKDAPYSPLAPAPADSNLWDRLVNMLTPFERNSGASELHVRASYHAALHTRQLLEEIVADVRASHSAEDADAIVGALLGVEQTPLVGFVIDTTGSMSDIIAGVQQQVQLMIDSAVATPGAGSRKFLVVDYGDPHIGTPFVGTASEVKSRVASLSAGGGGDCPELTHGGLLAALSVAPRRSVLYVFTDASSSDASRAGQVREAARAKQIAITFVASGSCSPIDPTYYEIATATGGLVLVTEHSSASVAAAFAGITIETEGKALRPVRIEQGAVASTQTIQFPVESGATTLTVQVASPDANVTFFAPNGSMLVAGPTVTLTDFLGGRSVKVRDPVAGTWAAVVTTSVPTTYTLRADVAAPLDLTRVEFARSRAEGRAGHEAFIAYTGEPPRTAVRLHAMTSGNPGASRFDLVGENGALLGTGAAVSLGEGAFASTITLPPEKFRVRLAGTDSSGLPFERVAPTIYQASTLLVETVDAPVWVAGGEHSVRLRVTNYAEPRNVQVTATPSGATLTAVTPTARTLGTGESGVFELVVNVPSTPAPSEGHALNIQASAGSETTTLMFPFDVAADSDGDGVPDEVERGRSGGDAEYDGNGDGTPDWKQAQVASLFSRTGNTYLTIALQGRGTFSGLAAIPAPAQGGASLPIDGFSMRILGLDTNASATLRWILADYVQPGGFHASVGTDTWVDHSSSGNAAVSILDHVLAVSVTDGGAADLDGVRNGAITLKGGPSGVAMAGVHEKSAEAEAPHAHEDSGGGCTVGKPGTRDGSLPLLALLAAAVLCRRRARRTSRPD